MVDLQNRAPPPARTKKEMDLDGYRYYGTQPPSKAAPVVEQTQKPSWIDGTPGTVIDRPIGDQADKAPIYRSNDQERKTSYLLEENAIQTSPLGTNRQSLGPDDSDSLIKRLSAVLLR